MSKTDEFNRQLAIDIHHKRFDGYTSYHNTTQSQQDYIDKEIENFWKCPLDMMGEEIQLGSKVAAGVNAGRVATIMVGVVTDIDSEKGIQVMETKRTYDSESGRKSRFGFPNRMVVIDC